MFVYETNGQWWVVAIGGDLSPAHNAAPTLSSRSLEGLSGPLQRPPHLPYACPASAVGLPSVPATAFVVMSSCLPGPEKPTAAVTFVSSMPLKEFKAGHDARLPPWTHQSPFFGGERK